MRETYRKILSHVLEIPAAAYIAAFAYDNLLDPINPYWSMYSPFDEMTPDIESFDNQLPRILRRAIAALWETGTRHILRLRYEWSPAKRSSGAGWRLVLHVSKDPTSRRMSPKPDPGRRIERVHSPCSDWRNTTRAGARTANKLL
jgi:hypothetical protein